MSLEYIREIVGLLAFTPLATSRSRHPFFETKHELEVLEWWSLVSLTELESEWILISILELNAGLFSQYEYFNILQLCT